MHSGTKYLDGQGRVIAGALCCSQALIDEKFMPLMRTAGFTLSPFNAWVVLKGMETLSIRVREQQRASLEPRALARATPGGRACVPLPDCRRTRSTSWRCASRVALADRWRRSSCAAPMPIVRVPTPTR